jgi:hypothetical protein
MVWKALEDGYTVVDASLVVMAVHQNHDYSHLPEGKQGVWGDEEARRNLDWAGGAPSRHRGCDATAASGGIEKESAEALGQF